MTKRLADLFETEGIPFFNGKKVVVTGATGLIGSYAVKLLKESGAHVVGVMNRRRPNEFSEMADALLRFDLSNPKEVFEVLDGAFATRGVDAVVACAGITGGINLTNLDPVSYVGPATSIFINTLHACWKASVPLVGYLSSTTVYPPLDRPAREEDSSLPDELYRSYRGIGQSKRFLEQLCRYYNETVGVGVAVVRPAGAYGRFDNFDEATSHFLPAMVSRALVLEPGASFEIWGDGGDVRDIVHAQDVARCLLMAMEKSPNARPFNVASGVGVTTRSVAEVVLGVVGSSASVVTRSDKPTALRTRLVDVSRARDELGFVPAICLEDGVRDVVRWRRA